MRDHVIGKQLALFLYIHHTMMYWLVHYLGLHLAVHPPKGFLFSGDSCRCNFQSITPQPFGSSCHLLPALHIYVRSRHLSYYSCPIIAHNSTNIVASFTPVFDFILWTKKQIQFKRTIYKFSSSTLRWRRLYSMSWIKFLQNWKNLKQAGNWPIVRKPNGHIQYK